MDQIQTAIEFIQNMGPSLHGFGALVFNELKTDVLSGAGKEIGAMSVRNLSKIFGRSREIHREESGRDFTPEELNQVPIDVGSEFLRVAKFVTNEELIEAYAALLESFVRDGQSFSRVAFVSMLNNMSGLDALIFRKIYLVSLSSPEPRNQDEGWQDASIAKDSDVLFENQNLAIQGILTSELPVRAFQYDARTNSGERHEGFLSQEILVSLGNLARLNLIEPDRIFDGGLNYKLVYRTPLGAALAEALRVKEES
jgi:hypothetical protein